MMWIGMTEMQARLALDAAGEAYTFIKTAPPRGVCDGAVWRVVRAVEGERMTLTLCAFAPERAALATTEGEA